MKDSICFIPAEHIINDKSYCNIVEFAFREDIILNYLRLTSHDERVSEGKCSDFDILVELIEALRENGDDSSRTYKYFSRVLSVIFDIDAEEVISGKITAEELWRKSSDELFRRENTLLSMLARSNLDTLCIAQTPWDYKELPNKVGNTEIKNVLCLLGDQKKCILDVEGFDGIGMLREHITDLVNKNDEVAVLLDHLDFEFSEPNPYAAGVAYDKYRKGDSLKNNELNILKTQLLRDLIFACAENKRKVSVVLSNVSNIKILYQTEQLLDYIDASLRTPLNITLFAPDVVGFSFASGCGVKGYKKITVEAAICGVDRYLMRDEVKYFGIGKLPEESASLAKTPASFARLFN